MVRVRAAKSSENQALDAGEGVLADRVADDEGDDDDDRGAGVDQQEQRDAPGGGDDGAQDVDGSSTDAIGQRTPRDGGGDAEGGCEHQTGEADGPVSEALGGEVGQHEGDRDGVPAGLRGSQAEGSDDGAPVGADDLGQRVLGDVALFLELLELRRLLDLEPDDDADHDEHGAEQERHPPRPLRPSGTLPRNARLASSSPTGKPAWVMPV